LKEENTDKAENLSEDDANYPAGALPKETVQIIKTFVKCLEYGKTLSRSNMILFCALFLSRSKCRGIIGNEGRKALWEYFNDVILNPCGYAPMDLESPKSPEEFAVMTAIINADLKAEYPLGEYICKTFLECDYSYVRDPITVACFAR
jgi:hypothetical protein